MSILNAICAAFNAADHNAHVLTFHAAVPAKCEPEAVPAKCDAAPVPLYPLRVFLAYKRAMIAAGQLPPAEQRAARGAAVDTMMRLIDMAHECDKRIAGASQ